MANVQSCSDLKKQNGVAGENRIHLAENRKKWRAFVITVMNRRVHYIREILEKLASGKSPMFGEVT
jgi:hypothetical protein